MSQPLQDRFVLVRNSNGSLSMVDTAPSPSPEEIRRKKQTAAICGHITRKLLRDEPLSGKLLHFALQVTGEDSEMADKLRMGQTLNEYQLYLMVDVYLVRERIYS